MIGCVEFSDWVGGVKVIAWVELKWLCGWSFNDWVGGVLMTGWSFNDWVEF